MCEGVIVNDERTIDLYALMFLYNLSLGNNIRFDTFCTDLVKPKAFKTFPISTLAPAVVRSNAGGLSAWTVGFA